MNWSIQQNSILQTTVLLVGTCHKLYSNVDVRELVWQFLAVWQSVLDQFTLLSIPFERRSAAESIRIHSCDGRHVVVCMELPTGLSSRLCLLLLSVFCQVVGLYAHCKNLHGLYIIVLGKLPSWVVNKATQWLAPKVNGFYFLFVFIASYCTCKIQYSIPFICLLQPDG